jgi:hypothetical protein
VLALPDVVLLAVPLELSLEPHAATTSASAASASPIASRIRDALIALLSS